MKKDFIKPNVKKYSQILLYFKDLYSYERSLDRDFNHDTWSARLGFKSSFMYLVCTGRRPLTMKFIDIFAQDLKLSLIEKNHLILLASYQKAKSSDLKTIFLDKILESLESDEINLEAKKYFQLVSSPHIPLIRMFLAFDDYKATAHKISKDLKISLSQSKKALQSLEEMDLAEKYFVETSKEIFWKSATKAVVIPQGTGETINLFHHRTMQEASDISQRPDIFKRFRSIIFAIPPEQHELLLEEIEKFLSKMKNRFGYNEVAGKHLLKLNLQAYPVTEVVS